MAPTSVERTLTRRVAKLLAPPPKQTTSQWADAERRLSSEASAESGRWYTDRVPFQRGIMDAADEDGVHTIVIMGSSQWGKTEVLLNTVGRFIDRDPSPILFVFPTLGFAEEFSKDRLAPMIRDTPALRDKVADSKSRSSGNTLLKKNFLGGHITLAGSNSPASLAGKPIRIVLCDEIDRFARSSGAEGDPVNLARKRTDTFQNSLTILCSTPTIDGDSRIQKGYEDSDQRKYYVPCPKCNGMQMFRFPCLKWDEDGNGNPVNVRYECEHCREAFDDSEKDWMLLNGQWVAHAPFNGVAGFHVSALYSPWKRWDKLVAEFLAAQKVGPEALKVFINTALGETWKEKGEAPEWERLYLQRESYKIGTIPSDQIDVVTAGVDVQKGRIEIEVVGWAKNKESWSIDYKVIHGDTSSERSDVWTQLDAVLGEVYVSDSGEEFPIAALGIDTGFETQTVYSWVRRHPGTRVFALKGQDALPVAFNQPKAIDVTYQGKKIQRGVLLWSIGSSFLKSGVYSSLELKKPTDPTAPYPPGYCHFPEYGEDYFQQLTAEQKVMRKNRFGFSKPHWEKIRERNEALDCRVYARAVVSILGIDRFSDAKWKTKFPKFKKVPKKVPDAEDRPKKERKRYDPGWL